MGLGFGGCRGFVVGHSFNVESVGECIGVVEGVVGSGVCGGGIGVFWSRWW